MTSRPTSPRRLEPITAAFVCRSSTWLGGDRACRGSHRQVTYIRVRGGVFQLHQGGVWGVDRKAIDSRLFEVVAPRGRLLPPGG